MLEAGCNRVTILAGSTNVKACDSTSDFNVMPCVDSQCEGYSVLRVNRNDGTLFWGCSEYPDCTLTVEARRRLSEHRKLFTREDISSRVAEYAHVVIVDDIVSSGATACSVTNIIRRL